MKCKDHDRKLEGGNIKMKDGTYSWVDNQGESAIPGETKAQNQETAHS